MTIVNREWAAQALLALIRALDSPVPITGKLDGWMYRRFGDTIAGHSIEGGEIQGFSPPADVLQLSDSLFLIHWSGGEESEVPDNLVELLSTA